MRKKLISILAASFCLFAFTSTSMAQVETNVEELLKISKEKAAEYQKKRAEAEEYARLNDMPVTFTTDDGIFFELQYIDENGIPMYYKTDNRNSAKTISTDKVYPGGGAGLELDGTGTTPREWDGGGVRLGHTEYGGRVTQGDNPSGTHWHATHVAGTIMAAGAQQAAKGMAYNANLRAFDWNSDNSEMASEAAAGAMVSNHSYGFGRGWSWTGSGWTWYGTPSVSTQEDYKFGFYDGESMGWDQIAANAPYYLIVKSAGNDRNEGPTNGTYPPDGPYDCIAHGGISKNTLTVGAVHDIPGGYSGPSSVSMSSFSSWGPADDGRVKPDIVANGVSLYSTSDSHNNAYTTSDGTSMSAPSATGSIALLHQHWEETKGAGEKMLASTVKGLIIHTADEAGIADGPDYKFGWGLMNTKNAALRISEDETINVIDEVVLNEGDVYEMILNVDGTEDVKVTICWTDVPGIPVSAQLDPTDPMLVNDLDLKVTFSDNTYYPWKLNPQSPGSIATNDSENDVDNVEVVFIESPAAGDYTITVDHDGNLSGGSQVFSIIISGVTNTISLPTANAGADIDVCEGSEAQLNGTANNTENTIWRSMGDGMFDDPSILNAIYTPGDSDIENGSVELELTAYGIAPSTDSIKDITSLTIVSAPLSLAGEDIVVCGSGVAQLNGEASNFESTVWVSKGDGTFDDASKLDAIYTPGTGDIAAGEVKLSLVANAIEPCEEESKDDLYITFAIAPVANAGEDGTSCGNMEYELSGSAQDNDGVEWSTSGDGSFDDINALNAKYTPGTNDMAAGTVILTMTAIPLPPCTTPESDDMTLSIEDMPDINAGDDLTSCGTTMINLVGSVDSPESIIWSTDGDGTFGDVSALQTTYIPGPSDVTNEGATLRLTAYFAVGCEMGFDEIVLGISPAAVSNAGSNDSVCKEASFTLMGEAEYYSSVLWTTNGDGSFADNSLLSTDYTPGTEDISSGIVELTLVAYPQAPCSEEATSTVTLEVLDCSAIAENGQNSIGMSIIPNPTNGEFTISSTDIEDGKVVVKIISIEGKVVYNREFMANGNSFTTKVNSNNLPVGIYTVMISTIDKAGISRLVVQH